MNESQKKKGKLFFELLEYVSELKENSDEIRQYSEEFFQKPIVARYNQMDTFESQNDKVFNINLYILIRLYKKEYNKIVKEKGKFTLEEYYDFIESIDLKDIIRELYMKMPSMVAENKILSYVTDMPSFMSMIK